MQADKYEGKFPLFSLLGESVKPARILSRIHFRPPPNRILARNIRWELGVIIAV
ncbi:hypothetical protein HMPREF9080_01106 [Cardiobacterium valvarum F0432]|uniref:Uncharacterized protein n=1 Tax=Cardiobacterium valvarum F0432 TaxID=797473 RepID=G9ZEB7_9GAMM|nr:hypothetical protein HMPREF9080_01106 [Cardiobacterium valvarum F0432]